MKPVSGEAMCRALVYNYDTRRPAQTGTCAAAYRSCSVAS